MILSREFIERARTHPLGERRRRRIALEPFARPCVSLIHLRKEARWSFACRHGPEHSTIAEFVGTQAQNGRKSQDPGKVPNQGQMIQTRLTENGRLSSMR